MLLKCKFWNGRKSKGGHFRMGIFEAHLTFAWKLSRQDFRNNNQKTSTSNINLCTQWFFFKYDLTLSVQRIQNVFAVNQRLWIFAGIFEYIHERSSLNTKYSEKTKNVFECEKTRSKFENCVLYDSKRMDDFSKTRMF